MWNKPWKFAEGFLGGAALMVLGLLLEVAVGPVVWGVFAWPVNVVVLGCFVAAIALMHLLRGRVYVFRFLSTYQAAVPSMVYAVVLTIIMGLTRQTADGRWLSNMLTFWPFVFTYVYMAVIVGLVTLKQLSRFSLSTFRFSQLTSFLFHLGLFVAMTTATLGNADIQRLRMVTNKEVQECRAVDLRGRMVELPLSIGLKQFILESYDDGSPRRFASDISIQTKSGKRMEAVIDVNKPVEVDGWKIYQYGYDTQAGANSEISILELVSDPWLPYVYAGIYMMLAGAFLMLFRSDRRGEATDEQEASKNRTRYWWILSFSTLLAIVFICVIIKPEFQSQKLMPALQSPWFAPHVIVYMFAYALLAVAVLMSVFALVPRSSFIPPRQGGALDNLVFTGLALLTTGMLFGALWAKEAWGHYWTWDPKETWAAITWFAYLIYIHYRQVPSHRIRLALWLLLVAFVLLQMCWWGINYLPSAQGVSVHTYGT